MDSGWLKILDVSGPRAILLAATCGLVVVGSERKWLALQSLPKWALLVASIAAIFFALVAASWVAARLWAHTASAVGNRVARKRSRAAARAHLDRVWESLSIEEAEILAGMLALGRRAQVFDVDSFTPQGAAASALLQRGILQIEATYSLNRCMLSVAEDYWMHQPEIQEAAQQMVVRLEEVRRRKRP